MKIAAIAAAVVALAIGLPAAAAAPALPKFTDHYATNNGVKIHYATAGEASRPLVVMIHGYPDYWYTWRNLMAELAPQYRVAAIDTRGYNLSDKPDGVAAYAMPNLVGDVEAVIWAEGRKSAIVVGHDWGASIALNTVLSKPQLVDRLIIMSVPHPTNMARELKTDPVQQQSSTYAHNFQKEGSEKNIDLTKVYGWMTDEAAKPAYKAAFARSSPFAMMAYYKANYPPDVGDKVVIPSYPKIKVPVMVIHGLKDTALRAPGHNGTWDQVDADTTLLMIPSAGHWIEQDAGPLANKAIHDWLNERPVDPKSQR
jgi:pimeloyl-ACP methyl ester carboxylesterase